MWRHSYSHCLAATAHPGHGGFCECSYKLHALLAVPLLSCCGFVNLKLEVHQGSSAAMNVPTRAKAAKPSLLSEDTMAESWPLCLHPSPGGFRHHVITT